MEIDSDNSTGPDGRMTFEKVVRSRRDWINDILKPWCRSASRRELMFADGEWPDLAGRANPAQTLWHWAWSRFPELCYEGLTGMNETVPVHIRCSDGRTATGYPDSRLSMHGELYLLDADAKTLGPFSIDDIEAVNQIPIDEM